MKDKKVIITDCTLRDGSHAVGHSISLESIKRYCKFAQQSGIPVIQVGHGNGISASSILIGRSLHSDIQMIKTARQYLKNTKLEIFAIPGLATFNDLNMAIDFGVDFFRIATHCTQASLSKSYIQFLKSKNKYTLGTLMMSALLDQKQLLIQASKMKQYGADAIILMDSTGSYLPKDVQNKVKLLLQNLNITVGFHSHNNLGCAVANSLIAAQSGATIIDGCIRGFGAGAGNAPIQLLIPVLQNSGFQSNVSFQRVIKQSDEVTNYLVTNVPMVRPINILTGLKRLFSGFQKPILAASKLYNIQYSALVFQLGNRKLIAGQQDLIIQVAQRLNQDKFN